MRQTASTTPIGEAHETNPMAGMQKEPAQSAAARRLPSGHVLLRTLAFALLGYLVWRELDWAWLRSHGVEEWARDRDTLILRIEVDILLGIVVGIVILEPVRWLLWIANPDLGASLGYRGVRRAVGAGFANVLPFALLACAAEFHTWGWDASSAFATAGLMAGALGAGAEVSRLGGKLGPNLLLGGLLGLCLATLWMLILDLSNGLY